MVIPVYVFVHNDTHNFIYMYDIYPVSDIQYFYIVTNFELLFYIQKYNICSLPLYAA